MTVPSDSSHGILKEMRGDLKTVTGDVATIKGQLEGKLHEPASCSLRGEVESVKAALSNSKGFLAGILFLVSILASSVTLGLGLLIQWLKG